MTCALGAGLCSIAGMMPDLDSGPGIPLRESVAFAAAVVPLMLVNRLHETGIPTEALILLGAAAYLGIRFGVTRLIKKFAIHRGMFHSLPAALIAGQITYLAFGAENQLCRYFMASAVVIGFLTHLVLDEIWSVRLGMFGPKFKKSFGTSAPTSGPISPPMGWQGCSAWPRPAMPPYQNNGLPLAIASRKWPLSSSRSCRRPRFFPRG
jgi:hypothetical protein